MPKPYNLWTHMCIYLYVYIFICMYIYIYIYIYIYDRLKLRVATAKNFVYFTSLFALLVWYWVLFIFKPTLQPFWSSPLVYIYIYICVCVCVCVCVCLCVSVCVFACIPQNGKRFCEAFIWINFTSKVLQLFWTLLFL